MFNNQLNTRYKKLLVYLISNGYKYKKDHTTWCYYKDNIIINIEKTDIIFKDTIEHRRFYFELDTPDNFLVNFLVFLDNKYKEPAI